MNSVKEAPTALRALTEHIESTTRCVGETWADEFVTRDSLRSMHSVKAILQEAGVSQDTLLSETDLALAHMHVLDLMVLHDVALDAKLLVSAMAEPIERAMHAAYSPGARFTIRHAIDPFDLRTAINHQKRIAAGLYRAGISLDTRIGNLGDRLIRVPYGKLFTLHTLISDQLILLDTFVEAVEGTIERAKSGVLVGV